MQLNAADRTDGIQRILRGMREHLGLDVAFVAQITEGDRIFRYVDVGDTTSVIEVGATARVEESYCHYVVRGQVPEFLPDPARHPVTAALAVTAELPVGTHLSIPITFSDGSLYGTFCCFSHDVKDTVTPDDLAGVRMMAGVVAHYLEEYENERRELERRRARLEAIVPGRDLEMHFQPIVELASGQVVGMEALARFPGLGQPPDVVFADAAELGIGVDLELAAVTEALRHLPLLGGDVYLSVNLSPDAFASDGFADLIASAACPPGRVVVELTEHAAVADYSQLREAVRRAADAGVRLAIDDVGMGFSGLHHIVSLRPAVLKIDRALVAEVEGDPARQAMIAALITFAGRAGCTLVAEGIETQAAQDALGILGVSFGQGYHLQRPAPLPAEGAPRS